MQTIRVLSLALIVALIALSCGQKGDSDLLEAPFFTSYTEGLEAAASGKSVLVDFFTTW
ncbi:MAG: hypothetical protein JSW34_06755 [Candidatus Zixiibacteriota bacterium]|nr:MAG: hypothetical protein JSW34_06755 [candidate division Zixibacteria bacterium]